MTAPFSLSCHPVAGGAVEPTVDVRVVFDVQGVHRVGRPAPVVDGEHGLVGSVAELPAIGDAVGVGVGVGRIGYSDETEIEVVRISRVDAIQPVGAGDVLGGERLHQLGARIAPRETLLVHVGVDGVLAIVDDAESRREGVAHRLLAVDPGFVLAEVRVALVRGYLSVLIAVIRVVVTVREHIGDGQRIHRPAVSVEVPLGEPILVAVGHAVVVGVIVGRVGDADQRGEERCGDARLFPFPVLLQCDERPSRPPLEHVLDAFGEIRRFEHERLFPHLGRVRWCQTAVEGILVRQVQFLQVGQCVLVTVRPPIPGDQGVERPVQEGQVPLGEQQLDAVEQTVTVTVPIVRVAGRSRHIVLL